jgi:hypothetical protein
MQTSQLAGGENSSLVLAEGMLEAMEVWRLAVDVAVWWLEVCRLAVDMAIWRHGGLKARCRHGDVEAWRSGGLKTWRWWR